MLARGRAAPPRLKLIQFKKCHCVSFIPGTTCDSLFCVELIPHDVHEFKLSWNHGSIPGYFCVQDVVCLSVHEHSVYSVSCLMSHTRSS